MYIDVRWGAHIARLQVRVDVAPVMQERHARRYTIGDGQSVSVGLW